MIRTSLKQLHSLELLESKKDLLHEKLECADNVGIREDSSTEVREETKEGWRTDERGHI